MKKMRKTNISSRREYLYNKEGHWRIRGLGPFRASFNSLDKMVNDLVLDRIG